MSGNSESMMERVAKAIAESAVWGNPEDWKDIHLSMARAAIEAMREPTGEMVKAGFIVERNYEPHVIFFQLRDPDTYDDPISFTAYKAMIAAALGEDHP